MLFESKKKADNFIRFNREDIALTSRKVPIRSYYCIFCCGWHVTSVEDAKRAFSDEMKDAEFSAKLDSYRQFGQSLKEEERVKGNTVPLSERIDRCRRELILTNLDTALKLYKGIVYDFSLIKSFVRSQKIDSIRVKDLRDELRVLQSAFDLIREYDVDTDTRQKYLSRYPFSRHPLVDAYIRNKDKERH